MIHPLHPAKFSDVGVVVFAGAGCSIAAPSSLPGWNDLNDAILEGLWDRLEKYGLSERHRATMLSRVKQLRTAGKFPPDYQAQLMADRVGISYFELLAAVDSDQFNPTQYYTTLLARAGLLKAVITTNFDQHFERCFINQKIPFTSYFDEEGFKKYSTDQPEKEIPIIKIHGCSSVPASMVDTRKQRLQGRAQALIDALQQLLEKHGVLFCGFSGADLDDDENYLGLRAAAPNAKGFIYLFLPGRSIGKSMINLMNHYGPEKACAVEQDPAEYLNELTTALTGQDHPFQKNENETVSFKERLRTKIECLEPLDAINMLAVLVESYGDEVTARYLYDKLWKERFQEDYQGSSFSRFLLNHARSYVFNFQDKIERAKEVNIHVSVFGDAPEGYQGYVNPASQNLRHVRNDLPEQRALKALMNTFLGEISDFSNVHSLIELFGSATPTARADLSYYYSFHALIHNQQDGLLLLDAAIKEMEKDCDEPRLSQLLANRSRFKSKFNEDGAAIDALHALRIAEKYYDIRLEACALLAMATVLRKGAKYTDAYESISKAQNIFYDLKRFPQFLECTIELLKTFCGLLETEPENRETIMEAVRLLCKVIKDNEVCTKVPAYEPEYCYLVGLIVASYISVDESIVWFADAVNLARVFNQEKNYEYFTETCRQLMILERVEAVIAKSQPS